MLMLYQLYKVMENEIKSDSSLEKKLRDVGYEKTEFEPVVKNRFIVKIDGIPSFVICGVSMPLCNFNRTDGYAGAKLGQKPVELRWEPLTLHLYNPISPSVEKDILELGKKDSIDVEITYLGPVGDAVFSWNFKTEMVSVNYGSFNWADTGDPNIIEVKFKVKEATIV